MSETTKQQSFGALVKVVIRFEPARRAELERALQQFVPNIELAFGWTNLGCRFEVGQPLCFIEWGLGSADEIVKVSEFEARPDHPAWYLGMQPLVAGERIDLVEGEKTTRLMDTL